MTAVKQFSEHSSSEVYRSLVQSLFSDSRILIVGIVGTILAVLICFYETGNAGYFVIAGWFGVSGAYRVVLNQRFHAEEASKDKQVDYSWWGRRFTAAAVTYALGFGIWCIFSSQLGNTFVQFVSTTAALANMMGICGRSFPIRRLVDLQIAAVCLPLVIGLWMEGGKFAIVGLLLLPFLIGLRNVAGLQRQNLLDNIFQRRAAEKMASQLDSALNNVSLGVCMFDGNGKLEVANRHIAEFTQRSSKSIEGLSIYQLISFLERDRTLKVQDADNIRLWLLSDRDRPYTAVLEMGRSTTRHIKYKAARSSAGGVICTFEDISDEVSKTSQIDYMKKFDRLTGLMNRSQLPEYVQTELDQNRAEAPCGVVLLNLDKFQQVNDTLGHHFGDQVLREVASRVSSVANDLGNCCRFGGDEFVVVVSGSDAKDLAQAVADQLIELLSLPYQIDGHTVQLGCSIGIAFGDGDTCDAATLLKNADVALLWAKKVSKGGWCVFTDEMSRSIRERSRLEGELRSALANDELSVFYQPLVSVENGRVNTCEALVRWIHPKYGNIPPSSFIPIAEDTGLISEIGDWVLQQACLDCAGWKNETKVAVNLSPLQFKNNDVVGSVKNALSTSKLNPKRLELEITESLMLENTGDIIGILNEFKELGARVALDDFGTGYSSLSYMNNLPLDKVKIDRSFVTGLKAGTKSLTLVQAISALGQQLDLSVVVEGIEEESELEVLLQHASIDEVQGYYFSKPVRNQELLKLLDRSSIAGRAIHSKMVRRLGAAA